MINTVLFDLDGTIIDTNEHIINSFIHALQDHAPAPFSREQIIPRMGMTVEQQIVHFTGTEDVTPFIKDYRSYYDSNHDGNVGPFPQVLEVIEELHARGIAMGVVTTKNRPGTLKVLEMFGLMKYMGSIVTVNDVEHAKPHPEPVLKAVQELGSDPNKTLMIGDSPADILAAQAAGVLSAGVSWSLKGEQALRAYNPEYMLHTMKDLYLVLEQG